MENKTPYRAGNKSPEQIEIKLPRCLLILTRRELVYILSQNPELWARAIKRGKAARRARALERRQGK